MNAITTVVASARITIAAANVKRIIKNKEKNDFGGGGSNSSPLVYTKVNIHSPPSDEGGGIFAENDGGRDRQYETI